MQRLVIGQGQCALQAMLARFSSAFTIAWHVHRCLHEEESGKKGLIVKLGSTRQMMTAPSPGVENSVPTTYWVGCA